MPTVRDVALRVLRQHGLTTIFGTPGRSEIALLTDLPDDFEFVMALHEGAGVGIATGFATALNQPALVSVSSTAGLGNALGALATARANRVPLVVLVGQRDRGRRVAAPGEHTAAELDGLVGRYLVWSYQPPRARDVPGALARAWHEARAGRGPAVVAVPSGDWAEPIGEIELPVAGDSCPAGLVRPEVLDELADLVAGADGPELVGNAVPDDWAGARAGGESWPASAMSRAGCPVSPACPGPAEVPVGGTPLRQAHVLTELAKRVSPDTVVVEETATSGAEPLRLLSARQPLDLVSSTVGGRGFALPAAIGVRMARPERPVVAVTGDGASLYGIQALWSAVHYVCGVLFVVLANGRYEAMDRLARRSGVGKPAWPAFDEVSVRVLARGFGCPAARVDNYRDLVTALDEVIPTLRQRINPLVLEVAVEPERDSGP